MPIHRLTRILAIVGSLLFALFVALNSPVAGYAFFTCLALSYVLCSLTGERESEPIGDDQKT